MKHYPPITTTLIIQHIQQILTILSNNTLQFLHNPNKIQINTPNQNAGAGSNHTRQHPRRNAALFVIAKLRDKNPGFITKNLRS
ncbi:hypothetical protein GYH30_007216 [Glycine max]|uniref:Uncharacterized protein n=2 Tax=Glycine subgen. Soja TaxID=1462606 RepID=A0A0R0KP67_SOYBN|nr:hypothetical protein GYH30_007216 [Glycine max]RZC20657.1 hypothetical protein D0Y65_007150 [Glycine soja]